MTLTRFLLGGAVAVLLLLVTGVVFLWQMMNAPMYSVGDAGDLMKSNEAIPHSAASSAGTWAVARGIELRHQSHGRGKPVLVLHGGPAIPHSGPWKGLAGLTDRYEFVYYHQRGCGESTRPFDRFEHRNTYRNIVKLESTLGLAEQIADIERIRVCSGQERLTLVGHSFGGFLATMYAAEFPERVEKLILVAPAGLIRTPSPETDLFELTAMSLDEADQVRFEELRSAYFDFAGHFGKSEAELAWLHLEVGVYILRAMGYESPELPHDKPDVLPSAGGWGAFAMYFSLGRQWDFSRAVSQIQVPTLVITGADDRLAKPGTQQYAMIESAEFVELTTEDQGAQAGHNVFDEVPVAFGDAVAAFLGN